MKNTITPEGNSALKNMLSNTSLDDVQLEMMFGFIDLMTGAPVFECMESMAKTIKTKSVEIDTYKRMYSVSTSQNKEDAKTIGKQKEEIERLKNELSLNNDLIAKMESRTDEKRSCENCKTCKSACPANKGICVHDGYKYWLRRDDV
jgi:predicted RNase H-like nuclease (RuvC/YqgF family)